MTNNSFLDKNLMPDEGLIIKKLLSAYPLLQELRKLINDQVGETREEWKYYGAKNGWVMKTLLKKRNLFFLVIQESLFQVTFVFGDKTVSAILNSDISGKLKHELREARKYAEGRSLSISVTDKNYLIDIQKLIKLKVEN